MKKLRTLLVFIIGMTGGLLPAAAFTSTVPDDVQGEYLAGRKTFYSLIRQDSQDLSLAPEDSGKLQAAQLAYPGLYEHLMGFYHLIPMIIEGQEEGSRLDFQEISSRMARDFLRSIPGKGPKPDISPLRSLLLSTGYYAQDAIPAFRRFSRGVHRKVKDQWAFKDMEVRKIHDISRGKGVRLAVIDTGLDPSLRDIRSHVVAYKDLLDRSRPGEEKGRFPYDWEGHGTSLASLILQVAPDVELMIVKFYEGESMGRVPVTRWTHYLIAAGIMWAARNGADIINLSVSLLQDTPALQKAIRYCWDHNIVIVASVGNMKSSRRNAPPRYPAAYPWTIAVGGVEKIEGRLKVWEYSAPGPYVDVVAPAKDIWVEAPQYRGRTPPANNRYGNSLAASFASGTTALLLSAMDSETRKSLKSRPGGLTEALRSILQQSASNQKLGFLSPNPYSGHGVIQLPRAVDLARAWSSATRHTP